MSHINKKRKENSRVEVPYTKSKLGVWKGDHDQWDDWHMEGESRRRMEMRERGSG